MVQLHPLLPISKKRAKSMNALDTLTEAEITLLAAAEQNISRNIDAYKSVGMSLATVRDSRLYRAEFATFEDYCERKWDISRRRAYQQIEAAQIAIALEKQGVEVGNEAQAAALAKVPADKRAEVLNIVAAGGEKVTASKIAEAGKGVTSTTTEPAPGNVKKISQERMETVIARETEKFLQLFEDFGDEKAEAIEEGIRFLFETVEERVIARRPEHRQTLAKALRSMLETLEGVAA